MKQASYFFVILIALFTGFSCSEFSEYPENKLTQEKQVSRSQQLIQQAIEAHGGDLYKEAHFSFVFRGNRFSFKNSSHNGYIYTRVLHKGDSVWVDSLKNDKLRRTINGKQIKLSPKEMNTATESINSVIYFATLPHKLSDKAVVSRWVESTPILGKTYQAIEVTFRKEGGGQDFEDRFMYWIEEETSRVDYLAYSYQTNGGGVRFRKAYNSRIVGGILFQDYINFKTPLGTELKELPRLLEAEKLTEISRIETEEVKQIQE